jgi:transcriptional antiterminator RfaH
MKRWYVVHTKRDGERIAEVNLTKQGFRTYCPQISAMPSKVRRVPVFPRYLFVELDLDADLWHSVNGTFGVVGLVQFGTKPSAVPPGVIEDIMCRENEDGMIVLPHPYPMLQAGDEIVLSDGPLDCQPGIIHRLTGPRRAEILLHLMGRQVKVTAPLSQVSAP